MERWLQSAAVAADPVNPEKEAAWQSAVKSEMSKVWDATKNRDEMLKHVEVWLAKDAPVEVRAHKLRDELYPLMVEVYSQKHPEDFEKPLFEGIPMLEDIG